MPDANSDLNLSVYAKTALGLQEIQSRTLGLELMARRLLILMDGKRSGGELATMIAGQDLASLVGQLLDKQCIERVSTKPTPKPVKPLSGGPSPSEPSKDPLSTLPAAETRSGKEVDMARNFMSNTVNMEFGQNMRISVIEAISNCATALELRQVYPLWYTTMGTSRNAAKELPSLNEKLFRVL